MNVLPSLTPLAPRSLAFSGKSRQTTQPHTGPMDAPAPGESNSGRLRSKKAQAKEYQTVLGVLDRYAQQLLATINQGKPLNAGQILYIKAPSTYLPLLKALATVAYKEYDSGRVVVEKQETQLERLKKKLGLSGLTQHPKAVDEWAKTANAAHLALGTQQANYAASGLSAQQIKRLKRRLKPSINAATRKALALNPHEVLYTALNLQPGQPLLINGHREYLPQIKALIETAAQSGTQQVDVVIEESREWDLGIPMIQHASEDVLRTGAPCLTELFKEQVENNFGRLSLTGGDPYKFKGLDSKRITLAQSSYAKARKPFKEIFVNQHWCMYYAPTKAFAKAAGYKSLREAGLDAALINRQGHLAEHLQSLALRKERLNELIRQGYTTLTYVSVDPSTSQPDGKTNLTVGLTPRSHFVAANMVSTTGHEFVPNVPTEEVFTTPDWRTVQGHATASLPLVMSGQYIPAGFKVHFENGIVTSLEGTETEPLLQKMQNTTDMDKLGEVAIVADSPIGKRGKVFNTTLLDENAASHVALGSAYLDTLLDLSDDPNTRQQQLTEWGVNDSASHIDFMIGSPQVQVYFSKPDGKDPVLLVDNDQFLLD
ncbi:MAG: aminopeptidase [Vampirovibrionales bacterium]